MENLCSLFSAIVDFAAVTDLDDMDEQLTVNNPINDAIIAYTMLPHPSINASFQKRVILINIRKLINVGLKNTGELGIASGKTSKKGLCFRREVYSEPHFYARIFLRE